MLMRRLHAGHVLLVAMAFAVLLPGLRGWSALREPMPVLPPLSGPLMADPGLLSRADPFFPGGNATDSLPVTALPLSLHGVRSDAATGRGSAIIASSDGVQQVFGVGDSVAQGVTLAAIAADHVVLDHGGRRETLWLDSAGAQTVQRFDPAVQEQPPAVAANSVAPVAAGASGAADQPASPPHGGAG